MPDNNRGGLTIAQVQADLLAALDAIHRAEKIRPKEAKYIKGLAGYHLQQAAEKMIKLQIYQSGREYNNAKMYRHSLDDLITYAESLNISLIIPDYVDEKKYVITRWEAQGRYDMHAAVRLDTLKRCYQEMEQWYRNLKRHKYS